MYCKLTNQMMQTHNGFQWELGKWYRIENTDRGSGLCSKSWFHCYSHPLLAILLNRIHANIQNPRLFRVNVKGRKATDNGLKFGFTIMKLAEEIPIPVVSLNQRIAFGILYAKQVYKDENWNEWANNWLNGKDRSWDAARAAAYVAAYAAAVADVDAAAYAHAARAAAHAARAAAYVAARIANAAHAAAYAAAYVDATNISLIKLAKQAMRY